MDSRSVPRAIAIALAGALSGALAPAAHALGLVEAWRAACDHDPAFAAARAAHEAGEGQREEAAALWRPGVSLEGGASYGGTESAVRGAQFSAPGFGTSQGVSFDTSVTRGTATRYALALRQPLHDRALDARGRELRTGADAADIEWSAARQALMLRSVDAYVDVSLAAERLRLVERQQVAVDRALAEARDRFTAGDRPVTAVHEATARSRSLAAQRLAARADLETRRAVLSDLTGGHEAPSTALPAEGPADATATNGLGAMADWLARAARGAPGVRLAQAAFDVAQARADGGRGALSPTAELVAQVGRERLSGQGDYGSASNASRTAAIGVRVSVPLYTGGLRSAQSSQANARVEEARARLEAARQQVAQQVRATWFELSVSGERIEALAAARTASRARLDATRTGLQAGERTTLDLLDAENDIAATELALAEARARVLTQRLRLAAIAGELDEAALQRADATLATPR